MTVISATVSMKTGGDAPPQFEPHRIECDLLAEALSLPVAAIKIVRKDGQQGAEKQLKHGSAPRSWRPRLSAHPGLPQQRRERCLHPPSPPLPPRAERRRVSRPLPRSR